MERSRANLDAIALRGRGAAFWVGPASLEQRMPNANALEDLSECEGVTSEIARVATRAANGFIPLGSDD